MKKIDEKSMNRTKGIDFFRGTSSFDDARSVSLVRGNKRKENLRLEFDSLLSRSSQSASIQNRERAKNNEERKEERTVGKEGDYGEICR